MDNGWNLWISQISIVRIAVHSARIDFIINLFDLCHLMLERIFAHVVQPLVSISYDIECGLEGDGKVNDHAVKWSLWEQLSIVVWGVSLKEKIFGELVYRACVIIIKCCQWLYVLSVII